MLCHWQENDGSLLTISFMTMTERKHKVLKVPKSVFYVFFKIRLDGKDLCETQISISFLAKKLFCCFSFLAKKLFISLQSQTE